MRFIGGKYRIAKDIVEILLKTDTKTLVEPFCGALNISIELIRRKPNIRVLCSDIHDELIDMWIAIQNGWIPPENINRDEYSKLRESPSSVLRTFVGYGCSFSGKWFGGFAVDNTNRNYCMNARNSILKTIPYLENIEFRYGSYLDQIIPKDAIVYCDPPYHGTTKPGTRSDFDSLEFWQWVQSLSNTCFVSEYSSPCSREVWRKVVKTDMQTKNIKDLRVEKLFINH